MKDPTSGVVCAARALLAAGLGVLCLASALAQGFPARPIRIVVPFGAGGVADVTARTVAPKIGASMGQPVIIDNKPGAGGIAAGDAVAKAEPDGHTLLLMSNGTAVSAGLFKSLPFDAERDFAPISTLAYFDLALLASPTAPYRTMADLLAWVRTNPGQLNVGTINVGSTQNLAAEWLKIRAGVDFQVIPFNGTPALGMALRAGQIDVAVEILGPMLGQIQSKAVRALAVMGASRASQLPDVPTLAQSGVTGFEVSSWNALAAPAKTPREVLERLNRAVQAAVHAPEVQEKLSALNLQARSSSPEQLATLLSGEIKRWNLVITRAGVPRQ